MTSFRIFYEPDEDGAYDCEVADVPGLNLERAECDRPADYRLEGQDANYQLCREHKDDAREAGIAS